MQLALFAVWIHQYLHHAIDLEVVVMVLSIQFAFELQDQIGVCCFRQFSCRVIGLEGGKDVGCLIGKVDDEGRVLLWMTSVQS